MALCLATREALVIQDAINTAAVLCVWAHGSLLAWPASWSSPGSGPQLQLKATPPPLAFHSQARYWFSPRYCNFSCRSCQQPASTFPCCEDIHQVMRMCMSRMGWPKGASEVMCQLGPFLVSTQPTSQAASKVFRFAKQSSA